MYTPPHFSQTDLSSILEFAKKYPFATLVNVEGNQPVAVHLPFIIEKSGDKITLLTHFSKVNSQKEVVNTSKSLVIFQEPHAYISPSLYEKKESVPTWNYIAVHMYGNATVITEKEDVEKMMLKMINSFENEYLKQWDSLSENYKGAMYKGIIAIKIEIDKIECSEKLSQNKSQLDQEKISNHLLQHKDQSAAEIGSVMKSKLNK